MKNYNSKGVVHIHAFFTLTFLPLAFISCSFSKSFTYFKSLSKDTTIQAYVSPSFESKIAKNDVLGVSVSSLNAELDQQFNIISKIKSPDLQTVETNVGFKVDESGYVYLHFLGKVKVAGLTKAELKKKLEFDLLPYLKEPIVTIQYLNKKVTVIGNVNTPGIHYLSEEKEPLLDILVKSGDLKDDALPSDLLIFRDSTAHKIVKHITLEDHSIFNSPWYYAQADDIIYVKKDVKQFDQEQRRKDLQITISLTASIVSMLLVIYNTLIK